MKVTSSWIFLSTLNYDARSTTHHINDAYVMNKPNKMHTYSINHILSATGLLIKMLGETL